MNARTIVVLSALGVGAGAGAWYFMDPKNGPKRRRRVRNRALVLGYEARRQGRKALRAARSGSNDLAGAVGARFNRRELTASELDRLVHRRIARLSTLPNVRAQVKHGRVTLSGPVLAHEADRLMAAVARIRGVDEVVNRMDLLVRMADVEEPLTGDGGVIHATNGGVTNPTQRILMGAGSTLGLLGLSLVTRGLLNRRTQEMP